MTLRPRRWQVVLVACLLYGLLLGVSFVVRLGHRTAARVDSLERMVDVQAVDDGRVTSERVEMVYREYASGAGRHLEAILLLHGSPGGKDDFESLAPMLVRHARVIAPDLPGFGDSTRMLPDYSFRAHAVYVRQLLDRLELQRVHVLGFSMGGGVALSLVDVAPERVSTLTLLSSIGVQEMELTGDYWTNHLVHGVQLAALWMAREGTPHMGLLDHVMLGVPYARNFFDSDQRPLRNTLGRVAVPTLILHAREDALVPIEAAREHHRLVPQSEIAILGANHFLTFIRASDIGGVIGAFVSRAAGGRALTRAEADPERVRRAALPFNPVHLPKARGVASAVFTGLLAAGILMSESVTSAAAGVLVVQGRVSLATAMLGCLMGVSLRSVALYARSRQIGSPRSFFLTSALSISMLLGLSIALSWTLVGLGSITGMTRHLHTTLAVAIIVIAINAVLYGASVRRRRLLLSSWRRWTRWEFWPTWLLYPPVVAYVGYLIARYRSATVFTIANPAILAGGFIGESKSAILQSLAGANEYVARSALIAGRLSVAERVLVARRFMTDQQLEFPIVLKPDNGQRGSGVVVVRSAEALTNHLERSFVDTIIQEYITGPEFGVFYVRHPSEMCGHIFSLTEKRFPTVVGDGLHTLEDLILENDRAVCSARLFCDRYRDKLWSVPLPGETIVLAELGTHCRGAMFLDGGWVLTSALAARFDSIARSFNGFYFGRFDVRVPGGIEAFRAGLGFKILELNGVTSEATHIYHPGTPLSVAYRVLMSQWRLAFEIGQENRRRGVIPTSVHTLVRLTWQYLRTSRGHLQ